MKLCALDFDNSFSIFSKDTREFSYDIVSTTNCNVIKGGTETNGDKSSLTLNITPTSSMVVCSVVIESETVFISVFNWLLNTNLYPDVTNLSLKRLSTTQIQLDFVPFDLTPFEFYCTLF